MSVEPQKMHFLTTERGMTHRSNDNEEYGPEETVQRRDEVLRRMLNTPPKPLKDHPPSREKNRKKADEETPGHDPEKSDHQ
jgi:hypothetical protein